MMLGPLRPFCFREQALEFGHSVGICLVRVEEWHSGRTARGPGWAIHRADEHQLFRLG